MPISQTDKMLSQRLVPATTDCVLYTVPDSNTTTYVTLIMVTNTTAASKTYDLYINQNGTQTADQFAMVKTRPLSANATDQFIYDRHQASIILRGSNASIIAKASVANTITIALYGSEVVET